MSDAIVTVVVNSLWQGTLLTLLVWLLMRDLPRVSAATKVAIWQATLAVVLLLPAIQFLGSLKPPSFPTPRIETAPRVETPRPVSPAVDSARVAPQQQQVATSPAALHAASETGQMASRIEFPREAARSALVVALALIAFQLLRFAIGVWYVRRLKGTSAACGLAVPIPLDRQISIRTSEQISMPMAIGFRSPMILLPKEMLTSLTSAELDSILLHEAAHLDRRDDWFALFERIVRTLFCFHPAVHLIGGRIERQREMACDDWAISHSSGPKPYAQALTRVAELVNGGRVPLLATGAGRRKEILRRLETMLDSTVNRLPSVSAVGLTVACALLLLAAIEMQPFQQLFGLSGYEHQSVINDGVSRREFGTLGKIQFSDDDQDVVEMSPGARLVVSLRQGFSPRRVELVADSNGNIDRKYFVGGKQHPFDAEARQFFAQQVRFWVRNQGVDVPGHLHRWIKQGGVERVMSEVRTMENESVKREYLQELAGFGLQSAVDYRRVATLVRDINSDDQKSTFLAGALDSYVDAGHSGMLLDILETIQSTDRRRKSLIELFDANARDFRNSATESALLMRLIREMGKLNSDDARHEALMRLVDTLPTLPSEVFAQIRKMGSDDHKLRVLTAIADRDVEKHPDRAAVASAFRAVSSIGSDSDRLQFLNKAILRIQGSPEIAQAALALVQTISAESEKERGLIAILDAAGKDKEVALAAVKQARSLKSEQHRAQVLLRVLEAPKVDADLAASIETAMIGMSEENRAAVDRELLRAVRAR